MFRQLALLLCLATAAAHAQKGAENNAALRYWNAFAQMSDQSVSESQSQQLEAIANGAAPWDEASFGKLLDENEGAITTMVRGTALPYCVWGVDYALADAAPIPQIGRGKALARLNALAALRRANQGDSHGATEHLIAGIRFARDMGEGMTLVGVLVGKLALTNDLNAAISLAKAGKLNQTDRARLRGTVQSLHSDVFDWGNAIRLEGEAMQTGLLRLRSDADPVKLLDMWGAPPEAKKDPRPSIQDVQQVRRIMERAERAMNESTATNGPTIASIDQQVAQLKPVAKSLIFSMQRTNDRRKEVEELREKFLAAMQ